MRDHEFYLAAGIEGFPHKPSTPDTNAPTPFAAAREQAKTYPIDKQLYLVRGTDVFVIHSNDIQVSAPVNGERSITIKKAKLVKYTEDGRIISD